jgi:hypothetical protein
MDSFMAAPKFDLHVFAIGGFADDGASLVDLVQPQPAGAADIDEHAARAADARIFEQRAN